MVSDKVIKQFKTLANKYISNAKSIYNRLTRTRDSEKLSKYMKDALEKLNSAQKLYESRMYTYSLNQALSALESLETVRALINWYKMRRDERREYMKSITKKVNSELVSVQKSLKRRESSGLSITQLDLLGYVGFQFLWSINTFNAIVYLANRRFWRRSLITRLEGLKHYVDVMRELIALADRINGSTIINYSAMYDFTQRLLGEEIVPRAAEAVRSKYPSRMLLYLTRRLPLLVQYSTSLMNYLENLELLPVTGVLVHGVFVNSYVLYEVSFSNKNAYELREIVRDKLEEVKKKLHYVVSLHFYEVSAYNLVVANAALRARDTKLLRISIGNAIINALAMEGVEKVFSRLVESIEGFKRVED